MVDVQALEHRENVLLVKGATQHWSDVGRGALGVDATLRAVILAQARGRCLVVGPFDPALLASLSEHCSSVDAVVRSIPDAARYGELLPHGQVWCGDVAALPAAASYETILCADFASVLPLESGSRDWADIRADVAARLAPSGTLILAVENDIGLHRLTASHNPRAANADADWSVLATWDQSRPRTVETLREAIGADLVWALGPAWPDVRWARRVHGPAGPASESAYWHTATWPLRGPDPSWLLRSATMAKKSDDLAAGWLAVVHPAPTVQPVLVATLDPGAEPRVWSHDDGTGTPLLALLADGCAAHDLPSLRRLLTSWRDTVSGCYVDPRPALVVVDGERLEPLVESDRLVDDDLLWDTLATLVATIRGRHWRHPWPSTMADDTILAAVAAMAGLPGDVHKAAHHVVDIPKSPDPFDPLDRQQLVAAIDRNNETIRTLRSRLAWTELQLSKAPGRGTPRTLLRRGLGKARRVARRIVKGSATTPG